MSTEWVLLSEKIYEYQKGIRPLFLCTIGRESIKMSETRLRRGGIAYHVEDVSPASSMVNLFFGRKSCIDIVADMVRGRSLSSLSPEEDFILGTLLGYDACLQCERYRKRKQSLQMRSSQAERM